MVERAVLHHDDDELLVPAQDLTLVGEGDGVLGPLQLLFLGGLRGAASGEHARPDSESLQRATT